MSARIDRWFPVPREFEHDLDNLTNEEAGATLRLWAYQWREGRLPADEGELQTISRMTRAKFRKSAARIFAKFADCEGGRIYAPLARERTEALRRAERQSRAGAVAAAARYGKTQYLPGFGTDAPAAHSESNSGVETACESHANRMHHTHTPGPVPVSSFLEGPHTPSSRAHASAREDVATPAEELARACSLLAELGVPVGLGDADLVGLVADGAGAAEVATVVAEAVANADVYAKWPWARAKLWHRRRRAARARPAERPVESAWRHSRTGQDRRARALGLPTWEEFAQECIRRGRSYDHPGWMRSIERADAQAQGTLELAGAVP